MKTYYIGKKYKIVETVIDSAKTAWKELEDMK